MRLILLLVLVACGSDKSGSGEKSPSGDTSTAVPTVEDAWTAYKAMTGALQKAIDASGDDCDKLGAQLGDARPLAEKAMALGKKIDEDPKARQEFETKHGREAGDLLFPIKKAFFKCKRTPAVAELIALFKS